MGDNKSPVFYRIITSSIMQDKKLRIPGKFWRKHRHDLTEVATVTTPNDCRWLVRLKKIDEKVFFIDGWYDFVEFQTIRAGYVLIFMYTGNSNFNVNVFNLADAEIKYQSKTPHDFVDKGFQYGFEKVDKGEIASACENRSNSLRQSPYLTRKRKKDAPIGTHKLESTITPKGNKRVLNEWKTTRSENPICEVTLRRSYVYDKATCLYFPSAFAKKHLDGVSGLTTLQISSGKKWLVRFMWRDGSAKLCRGWREFVRDNDLAEGDLCVFELVQAEVVMLKVTIKRSLENAILE